MLTKEVLSPSTGCDCHDGWVSQQSSSGTCEWNAVHRGGDRGSSLEAVTSVLDILIRVNSRLRPRVGQINHTIGSLR